MMALVKNGIVEKIQDVSDDELQTLSTYYENIVDITNASPYPEVGWLFNGVTFSQAPGSNTQPSKKITKLAFLSRITDSELIAIESFAAGTTPYAYAVRAALRKQSVATYIDLSLPETANGLQSLVALGLITQERVNIILNTEPKEHERYKEK